MNISLPSVLILAAKPKSGKSHAIKYFMHAKRKEFDYGIVFTKTKFTDAYNYVPDQFVQKEFNAKVLKKLMKIQGKLTEQGIKKNAFVIFDDCLTSEFGSQLVTDLLTQYRHYNITVILSTQYIYKLNPVLRDCATHAFIFEQSTKRSIEAIYETFGQHFNTLNDFCEYLNKSTGNYWFLFVDIYNRKKMYSKGKVGKDIPNFKLQFNLSMESRE